MEEERESESRYKEDWLREESRHCRGLLVSLMQRGIAVLALIEVVLYYVRQDMTAHLRELGRLPPDQLLPFSRYAIGTVLLLIIAFVFARYAARIANHYTQYRLQLVAMTPTYSGVAEPIAVMPPTHHWGYYIFPIFDLSVWLFYYLGQWFFDRGGLPW